MTYFNTIFNMTTIIKYKNKNKSIIIIIITYS